MTAETRIEIYDTKVLGMVKWIYNGVQRRIFDISEFQDDVDVYEYGGCEAGAISIQGMYDPTDTTGQAVLKQVFDDCVGLREGQIKFFVGENNYFTVDSDGRIQILMMNRNESKRDAVSLIEMDVHDSCKNIFFSILKPETVQSLLPEYEG